MVGGSDGGYKRKVREREDSLEGYTEVFGGVDTLSEYQRIWLTFIKIKYRVRQKKKATTKFCGFLGFLKV